MGWLTDIGQQLVGGAAGGAMGMVLGGINDRYQDKRQLAQQGKLQAMQEAGQIRVGQAMGDYNLKNAKDMWEYTGYEGQKRQIKEAGLNPALLYGMKGGGGITTGPTAGPGNVGSDTTMQTSIKPTESMAMGMQLGLLRAQKELIEAQRDKAIAEIPVAGAQTKDLTASAEGKGLANALTAWLQGVTKEGEEAGTLDKSVRGQQEIQEIKRAEAETTFKIDENERQKIMNNAQIKKLSAQIELMNKQGLSQDQITENLKKEGLLKDAEIEWNKLDIKGGNFGKFLTNLLKMLVRPK